MALAERPGAIFFEGRDEALSARLDLARRNREFLEAQYADLLAQYPDQWVAAYKSQIVAVAPNLEAMMQALLEKGIPANEATLEYFDTDDAVLVL